MPRETAITALATLLAADSAINSVRRDTDLDLLSARSLPCVIVQDNGVEAIEYKTAGYADVYVTVDLIMLVKKSKNQSSALNALDVAVKKVIGANSTLSGTCAHCTILPQITGETLGADDIAQRTRQVRIFYEATIASGL